MVRLLKQNDGVIIGFLMNETNCSLIMLVSKQNMNPGFLFLECRIIFLAI